MSVPSTRLYALSFIIFLFSLITVKKSDLPSIMLGHQTFEEIQNKAIELTLKKASDPKKDPLTYFIVNEFPTTSGTSTDCLGQTNQLTCTYPPPDVMGRDVFLQSQQWSQGLKDHTPYDTQFRGLHQIHYQ